MLFHITKLIDEERLRAWQQELAQVDWVDGRRTAGHVAGKVKRNLQLPDDAPLSIRLGEEILAALARHPVFLSAAMPLKILPPRFNRYEDSGTYGSHVDASVFSVPGTVHRVRSDLSMTVFLNPPDEYEGGELVVQHQFGQQAVKLPAGDAVLYPASSVHHVTPVTRGVRLASFFWIQSLVRDGEQRNALFELDAAIQQLAQTVPEHPAIEQLTGVYHNLMRQWAQT